MAKLVEVSRDTAAGPWPQGNRCIETVFVARRTVPLAEGEPTQAMEIRIVAAPAYAHRAASEQEQR